MHAYRLTGVIKVAPKADSRKASIHAGSTVLTGLTGASRAHMKIFTQRDQLQHSLNKFSVRMKKTMLTLLTLFKASVHAGFSVTGFALNPDSPCKEA